LKVTVSPETLVKSGLVSKFAGHSYGIGLLLKQQVMLLEPFFQHMEAMSSAEYEVPITKIL
jgi:hypothetical protein